MNRLLEIQTDISHTIFHALAISGRVDSNVQSLTSNLDRPKRKLPLHNWHVLDVVRTIYAS